MSVSNGQIANATTFNNAFLSKTQTDVTLNTTIGVVGMNNVTDPNSGNPISNVQQFQNEIADSDGTVGTGDATRKVYSSTNVVADGDNRKIAIGKLDFKFDPTNGHKHTGAAGDAPPVSAFDLSDFNKYFAYRQTTVHAASTGSSTDVSAEFSTLTPGGSDVAAGVVTDPPHNMVELRDASDGEFIEDAFGNKVYGRLTFATSVWTLSYFVLLAGVETPFTLAGSTDVQIYFIQVFDSATRPTFNEETGFIGDYNLTSDIVDATPTQPGKVSTAAQSFGGKKDFTQGVILEGSIELPKTDVAGASAISALTYSPFVNITGTTPTNVQGIASGSDGKTLIIHNSTTQLLTVSNENTLASASNRIHLPQGLDVILGTDESIELIYNTSISRWVIKSGSGNGSGSGSGGINFLSLDSGWKPTKQNNFNAETSVGDWEAFDNNVASIIAQDIAAPTTNVPLALTTDRVGQLFTAGITAPLENITLKLAITGGATSGPLIVGVYDDAAGVPGTFIEAAPFFDTATLTGTPTDYVFAFTGANTLTAATPYHIVIDPSGATQTGIIEVSSSANGGGTAESSSDGGGTWTPVGAENLYYIVDSGAGLGAITLTGGTPTVAISRTTTSGEVLDGSASFKVVKDANDRLGEGVACQVYFPPGYRGNRMKLSFPFKLLSGGLVGGDLIAVIYDITNSSLIQSVIPQTSIKSLGIIEALFDIPASCATARVGLLFNSSSAIAATFSFDDIALGLADKSAFSLPGGKPTAYVPTFVGPGIASTSVYYSQEGKYLFVQGTFLNDGTAVSSSPFSISLPPGLFVDSDFVDATAQIVGAMGTDATNTAGTPSETLLTVMLGSSNNLVYATNVGTGGGTNNLTQNQASNIVVATNRYSFWFKVPIKSFSGAIPTSVNNSFPISTYLSGGNQVTSTPTALGEYRAFTQNSSNGTGFDDPITQTNQSLFDDGFALFGFGYATTGTSGQPSRVEIFIGKNKYYQVAAYAAAGRSGSLQVDHIQLNPTTELGINVTYEPTTGVLVLDSIPTNSGTTGRFVGGSLPLGGGSYAAQAYGYFEIFVGETVLPVQFESDSEDFIITGSPGYGSTNIYCRIYDNLRQASKYWKWTTSPSLGDTFTCLESGNYEIYTADVFNPGYISWTLNSSDPTLHSYDLPYGEAWGFNYGYSNNMVSSTKSKYIKAGDILRGQHGGVGASPLTSDYFQVSFHIKRIS